MDDDAPMEEAAMQVFTDVDLDADPFPPHNYLGAQEPDDLDEPTADEAQDLYYTLMKKKFFMFYDTVADANNGDKDDVLEIVNFFNDPFYEERICAKGTQKSKAISKFLKMLRKKAAENNASRRTAWN